MPVQRPTGEPSSRHGDGDGRREPAARPSVVPGQREQPADPLAVSASASEAADPTVAVTVSRTDDPRALRLLSVLASGLPVELGTPAEPARYTVPAVFSRQVSVAERALIEDPATARRLEQSAGVGPGLALAVSDRRLLIMNTTLAELAGGLAAAIGAMLTRMGQEQLTEMDRRSVAATVIVSNERERAEAVARAAAAITFGAVDDHVGPGYPTEPR